jgi:hypothetical protein
VLSLDLVGIGFGWLLQSLSLLEMIERPFRVERLTTM